MIKLKNPSPVYLKGGHHAILLLHSFTGTVRDVKHLANRLHQRGFTTYVPSYPGHGLLLEDFLSYDIKDWWQTVVESYEFLKSEGYKTISAAGVSLGGLFTLKLLEEYDDLEESIVMSVPCFKDEAGIFYRLEQYGIRLNSMLGLSSEENVRQLNLIQNYKDGAVKFCNMIDDIMQNLDNIKVPVLVMYGLQDNPAYTDSAKFIYDHLNYSKELEGIHKGGHLLTFGRTQQQVEDRIVDYFFHKKV